MTKKETIREAWNACVCEGRSFLPVLEAIIDALPEEARPEDAFETLVIHPNGVTGYNRRMSPEEILKLQEMFYGSNAILGQRSTGTAEPSPAQPTSDWHRVYQMAKELMQLSEERPVSELDPKDGQCSALGPQQPPNVASGATQPYTVSKDIQAKALEEVRKLRIMKTMEHISAVGSEIRFKLTPTGWYWTNASYEMDWQQINDFYCPNENGVPFKIGDPEEQRIDKEIDEVKAETKSEAERVYRAVYGNAPEAEKLWKACVECGKIIEIGQKYCHTWDGPNGNPRHWSCWEKVKASRAESYRSTQPSNIGWFTGVRWCRSGDGITFRWYASFVLKDGTTEARPLDECREPDGTPWEILGHMPKIIPAPEKLWEGETWTLPDSVQCWAEPYDADPRWRRIKVKEQR